MASSTSTEKRIPDKLHEQRSPKKNRGIVWSDEATDILLELQGEETIQLALENAKYAKETREVYRRIMVITIK